LGSGEPPQIKFHTQTHPKEKLLFAGPRPIIYPSGFFKLGLYGGFFTESVKSANALLLIMKGTDMRLDASLQQMLREMEALFGEDMWNHVVVGVSFWSFDEDIVEDRNR
jgi:hypothetical protein